MQAEAGSKKLVVTSTPRTDGGVMLATEKGSVECSFPKPDLLLARYSGALTGELYGAMAELVARRLVQQPSLRMFIDLEAVTDFEAAFRDGWAGWFRTNRKSLRELHVLFRSRLIGIALTVIGVATGGNIKTYGERAAFDQALGAAKRGA